MEIELVHAVSHDSMEGPGLLVDLTVAGLGRHEFTYSPADTSELTLLLTGWLLENPDFPIGPYVAPPPIAPLTQTLTKRQVVRAMIIGAAITDPDGFVETAIGSMTDDTSRAIALSDWRYAPYFERGHALFSEPEILTATGMSPATIDALWGLGFEQPR